MIYRTSTYQLVMVYHLPIHWYVPVFQGGRKRGRSGKGGVEPKQRRRKKRRRGRSIPEKNKERNDNGVGSCCQIYGYLQLSKLWIFTIEDIYTPCFRVMDIYNCQIS